MLLKISVRISDLFVMFFAKTAWSRSLISITFYTFFKGGNATSLPGNLPSSKGTVQFTVHLIKIRAKPVLTGFAYNKAFKRTNNSWLFVRASLILAKLSLAA
ncbi:hypothetical protein D1094_18055 [Colwellia sp. RSH04]|nr:hypothetical protein D1094_18055 [Colwellia sp. RSH04]